MTEEVTSFASPFPTLRRFYLKKRMMARGNGEHALSGLWQGRQEAETGTDLPSDFPSRAALIAAGYPAVQDLEGADASELREWARLSAPAANAVVAAYAAL